MARFDLVGDARIRVVAELLKSSVASWGRFEGQVSACAPAQFELSLTVAGEAPLTPGCGSRSVGVGAEKYS
ncbi:MAG: hypothetical protein V3V08_18050 [Nannocystaceae bacterium]